MRWRGFDATVTSLSAGDTFHPEDFDLLFMGGGQDAQQVAILDDLHRLKAESIKQAASNGVVLLTICGGYQLLGHYYQPHDGDKLQGLSLIDAYTIAGAERFIGNVVIERLQHSRRELQPSTIVGFENHSGLTYLADGVSPLGKVTLGKGNNGQDGTEGVWQNNLIGTYLHGSLLPKNPMFTDAILKQALYPRYGFIDLLPLEDTLAAQAHETAATLSR